jgi:hypothetical protein
MRKNLYDDWLEFHPANSQIYDLYCKYADKVIDRGFKKCSSTAIWGVINFEAGTKILPRKYCAYYARYWMERHPEYGKFFKKRSKTIGPLTS